jgi:DNA-binding CsgD family transcriptional regulator
MQASGNGEAVLFYAEQQLQPAEDNAASKAAAHASAPHLVPRLLAADSCAQREVLVRGMLHAIGFEWFAYGVEVLRGGRSTPKSFFTSYSHPQWTRRYFSERYHEVDPRHLDAPRSGLPLAWDIQDIDSRLAAQPRWGRSRHFAQDFRDSGIRSGVFFNLPSATSANERIVISLQSSSAQRGWIGDRVLGQALTFGLSMHEFLSRHMRPARPQQDCAHHGLSALQQSILQCLSRGQSDKEIAHGLQLSTHAVDYHMRQLRRRFAVRNRVQLINAATT